MRLLLPLLRMGVYEDLRYRLRSSQLSEYICLVAIATAPEETVNHSTLVGTVEVTLRSNSPFQLRSLPYPYLSNLAVRTEARRQGVAQRLLTACERMASERGFHELYLHVLENNHAAMQLYFKAGYELRQADTFWWCCLFNQPRKLLLYKRLAFPHPSN